MSEKKRGGRPPYPVDFRERAVRMVFDHENEYPSQWKAARGPLGPQLHSTLVLQAPTPRSISTKNAGVGNQSDSATPERSYELPLETGTPHSSASPRRAAGRRNCGKATQRAIAGVRSITGTKPCATSPVWVSTRLFAHPVGTWSSGSMTSAGVGPIRVATCS